MNFSTWLFVTMLACAGVAYAQSPSPSGRDRTFDQIIKENDEWLRNASPAPSLTQPQIPPSSVTPAAVQASTSPRPQSPPTVGIVNDIVCTVSMVIQLKSGADIGFATGFFYARGEDIFLVTNQHVFLDDKAKDAGGNTRPLIPDTLRLKLHVDANDTRKVADLDVPLYKGKDKQWKVSRREPTADVALIKLDAERLKKRFVVKAWSQEAFLPRDLLLSPGEDVFIMGYPLGLHDTVYNLPIFRNAMLASTYRVPFQGQPCFLTDANIHPGLSGSPIITKPKSTWVDDKGSTRIMTGVVYHLIGIHSAYLNLKDPNQREIGLGVGWYAELIEEIAASF